MLREGRAFRPWSIGRWLDGHHPDPLSGVSHGWSLAQPFRSCAHGLQSHPSRSREYTASIVRGFLGHYTSKLNPFKFWPNANGLDRERQVARLPESQPDFATCQSSSIRETTSLALSTPGENCTSKTISAAPSFCVVFTSSAICSRVPLKSTRSFWMGLL